MPASPLRSLLLTLALTLGFALPSGATTWHDGDMVTYNQTTWGDLDADASTLLATYYATVYQSTFGVFEIGIPGVAGFARIARQRLPESDIDFGGIFRGRRSGAQTQRGLLGCGLPERERSALLR